MPKGFFDDLEHGRMSDFAALLKPVLADHHAEHVAAVAHTESAHEDMVCGVLIHTPPGVYRPHLGSSSQLLLRAMWGAGMQRVARTLEIGAGSGAVGLALLKNKLTDTLVAVDISPLAIDTCRHNAASNGLVLDTRLSDLFSAIAPDERFDRIVFNVPLWHKTEYCESELALVDPGGALVTAFLTQADAYLTAGGTLWLTYSNLSLPHILTTHANRWQFVLQLAEYEPRSGLIKTCYQVVPRRRAPTA